MRYVARQPIVDREERVFGYELLFRDGLENAFTGDAEVASRATLDRSLLTGLDVLCDGRRAFLNCTRDTLIKGLVTLLPGFHHRRGSRKRSRRSGRGRGLQPSQASRIHDCAR